MGRMLRLMVVVAVLAAGVSAPAEDKEAARRAYSEGSRSYNLAQYADALEAFKRAYWNYDEPSFLYNIAQCHRALKHKNEAIEFYRSYLRNAPNAPNRAEVERIIAELEAAVQKDKAVADAPPEGTLAAPPGTRPSAPPPSAPEPATTAPTPAPAAVIATTSTPAPAERPVWKRGWFWGVMAGAAVVVAGVAVGVTLGTSTTRDPTPSLGRSTVN